MPIASFAELVRCKKKWMKKSERAVEKHILSVTDCPSAAASQLVGEVGLRTKGSILTAVEKLLQIAL